MCPPFLRGASSAEKDADEALKREAVLKLRAAQAGGLQAETGGAYYGQLGQPGAYENWYARQAQHFAYPTQYTLSTATNGTAYNAASLKANT